MNPEQFDLFRRSIQWVLDDYLIGEGLASNYSGNDSGVTWDQDVWFQGTATEESFLSDRIGGNVSVVEVSCGSVGCVAGNIAVLDGAKLIANVLEPGEFLNAEYCVRDGQEEFISTYAMKAIGVEDTCSLFGGDQTIEEVIGGAMALADEHGYTLDLDRVDLLPERSRREVEEAKMMF